MNFWTKPFEEQEMSRISCSEYWPGRFSEEGQTFSMLDIFLKLKSTKKLCDPVMFLGAMLANRTDGWNEGLLLIQEPLEKFLHGQGRIPLEFKLDLTSFKNRIELHTLLVQDKAFVRKELRLELIKIIEGLE